MKRLIILIGLIALLGACGSDKPNPKPAASSWDSAKWDEARWEK